MLGDYIKELPNDQVTFRWFPPFSGYIAWETYIRSFAADISTYADAGDVSVQNCVRDCLLGTYINTITQKHIEDIIFLSYYNQISHNSLSNDLFTSMRLTLPPYVRIKDVSSTESEYTILQQLQPTMVSLNTSLEWTKLTMDMSSLCSDDRIRERWQHFYRDMSSLDISAVTPLLFPDEIEASTGI